MLEAIRTADAIYERYGNDVYDILENQGVQIILDPLAGNLKELYFGSHVVLNQKLRKSEQRCLLAHVLGHIFLHEHKGHQNLYVDSMNRSALLNVSERCAEIFAAYLLVPEAMFDAVEHRDPKEPKDVERLARRFKITSDLALFRLQVADFLKSQNATTETAKPPQLSHEDHPRKVFKNVKVVSAINPKCCASEYEEQVQQFLETLSIPAYTAGSDGRIAWLNNTLIKLMGQEHLSEALSVLEGHLEHVVRLELMNHHRRVLAGSADQTSISFTNGRAFELSSTPLREKEKPRKICCIFTIMKEVTSFKAARAGIAEKELIIDAVSKASPAALFVYDLLEHKLLWASQQVLEITGYSHHELTRLPSYGCFDLLLKKPTEDDPTRSELREDLLLNMLDGRTEVCIMRKDGQDAWLSVTSNLFQYSEEGFAELMLGVAEDITEHKNKDLALEASESRYRRLAMAPHLGVLVSEDQMLVDCNDEAVTMFGYTKRELKKLVNRSRIWKFIDSDEISIDRSMIQDENSQPYRGVAIRKDGSRFPIEVSDRAIDAHGRDLRITSFKDISDQVALENALKKSEWRYRSIVDSAPVCIARTNFRGEILYVNEAMLNLLEYVDFEQFKKLDALGGFQDATSRKKYLNKLEKSGRVDNQDLLFVTRTGKLRCLLVSSQADGEEITSVAVDITQQKHSELKRQEQDRQYKRLLDNTSVGIIRADLADRVYFVNKRALEMLGLKSQRDVLSSGFSTLFAEQSQRTDLFDKLYRGRSVINLPITLVKKGGAIMKCLVSGSLHGSVAELSIAECDEISELKKQATETAKIMRELIENPLFAIAQTDRLGQINYANGKCLDLFCAETLKDLKHEGSMLSRFPASDTEFLQERIAGAGGVRNFHSTLRTSGGIENRVVVNCFCEGEKLYWIMMDVTADTALIDPSKKKRDKFQN